LDTCGRSFSRRGDFLRLARWFSTAEDDGAHRLNAAAFGAYPSRHLLFGPEEPDPRIGPTASWWDSDPVHVPVSLRERGDRAMRGRSSRIPDPTADRVRLVAEAEREAEQRRSAAAGLALTGPPHQATISPAARALLLDLVAARLARHRDEAVDHDVGLRLHAVPGGDTVVASSDGTTTFVGLSLSISSTGEQAPTMPGRARHLPDWTPTGQDVAI